MDDCLVLVLAIEAAQGQTPLTAALRSGLVALSLEIRRSVGHAVAVEAPVNAPET